MNKKITKEKEVLALMIKIYCQKNKHNHDKNQLCQECQNIQDYAFKKLDACPYQPDKDFCSFCKTHCYHEDEAKHIREIMRYSGKYFVFYQPVFSIKHLAKTIKFRIRTNLKG